MHDLSLDQWLESSLAVIGLACRFPGANGVDAFWDNLCRGVESVTFFSDVELRAAGVDPTLLAQPSYVKANAVLDDIEWFDAGFFGFTPREAEISDPQQRLFLEIAWEALENAGYDVSSYRGRIGTYAGVGTNTYLLNLYSNPEAMQAVGRFRTLQGNDKDFLASLVAYKLNLRGPAISVQTACSTSLIAVHLACQSLLNGECDMALAGGVSFSAHQRAGYVYQAGGIHSSDGHCRPFDARAEGTVGGNGLGITVLKRLKDALQDGDFIHALVRGTAVNNDGAAKVGFTAPSVDGQATVISEALALAGVEPATISYVEAHGTGTALGDPIEIAALTTAFQSAASGRCGIGSVKSNIGHLDTASGIAGFIKTVLALEHRTLPPTLHFERPNPNIRFEGSPFFVVDRLTEWQMNGLPLRAGVSSFGIGGTNAHVVLEEAPPQPPSGPARPWHLIALSASTASALETATANLGQFLKDHPAADMADVAYTLQVGRKAFRHRRIAVCRDPLDAVRSLTAEALPTRAEEPRHRPVAFLFPGQGAQYPAMAHGLYREEPSFRGTVDLCCEALRPHLGLDLREVLFALPEHEAADRLRDTCLAQPALFTIEYALARLWIDWGVRPEALLGHSIGEYVAACLAGIFDLHDALRLVAERGRLIQSEPAGSMLAIALAESELSPLLSDGLSLAAVNGPAACVVSGTQQAVADFAQRLRTAGVEHRSIHTSHAFHSSLMDPVLAPFAEMVRTVSLSPPKIPVLSNLTGVWMTAEQAIDPEYWIAHLRHTVRFSSCLETLAADPNRILLEVGPGNGLARLARQQGGPASRLTIASSMRHPREDKEDLSVLLQALGSLWMAGIPIDWKLLYNGQIRRRVQLPTYPFERQRYWVELKEVGARSLVKALEKRPAVRDWFHLPVWRESPQLRVPPPVEERPRQRWLLFRGSDDLSAMVAGRLRQLQHDLCEVFPGKDFAVEDHARVTIDPGCADHYRALFATLGDRAWRPDRIVHLWNATEAGRGGLEGLATTEIRSFYSLLFLAQALPAIEQGQVQVDVISLGLHRIAAEEEIEPGKALLLGPVRVLPRERTDVVCRSIDLAPTAARQESGLNQLIHELTAGGPEPVVALRGGRRWIQGFEPVPAKDSGLRVRERGVYLITGGLGGVGLTIAEELARQAPVRLVLVSRSGLPAREQWDRTLAAGDPAAAAIRAVQSLESLGAEVLVTKADVADLESMKAGLRQAQARFGPIIGVVHAAGVPGGGIIEIKTESAAAAVLASKVRGTLVLDALLGKRPLDFFVLCSSLTAVIGGVGQVDYCAANCFLDAFAQSRSAYGSAPVLAIDWSAWSQVGMAVRTELPFESPEQRRQRLARAILPEEGVAALGAALALGVPQVLVSPQDLMAVINFLATTDTLEHRLKKGATAPAAASSHRRPDLPKTYVAPNGELEQEIAAVWQEVLGLELVGANDDFSELGGDSLMGIRVLSRLRERFGVEIPLHTLFECPTVSTLAIAILELQLGNRPSEEIQQLLAEVSDLSQAETVQLLEASNDSAEDNR